jgi:predicted Zn-dependent protease
MASEGAAQVRLSSGSHRGRSVLLLTLFVVVSACGSDVTDPGDDPGPPNGYPTSYDHTRSAGASARDLLSASDFDRLIVQVQYVSGFRPSDEGLQLLEAFLNERLDKPGGIEIQVDEPLDIESQPTYTVAQVRAIEDQNRTAYTGDGTLAVYLLFLDGEYDEQANVLGIAYNNTSMALFEEKVKQHSGGALEPSEATVEGVVASHEVGHLLGLVNNGSAMQTEHQDEGNGRHCDNENCLMHYAVRTTDVIANLLDGMPELDQDCIDDLQANGGL